MRQRYLNVSHFLREGLKAGEECGSTLWASLDWRCYWETGWHKGFFSGHTPGEGLGSGVRWHPQMPPESQLWPLWEDGWWPSQKRRRGAHWCLSDSSNPKITRSLCDFPASATLNVETMATAQWSISQGCWEARGWPTKHNSSKDSRNVDPSLS